MASSDAAAANRSLLANGSACAAMHVRRTDKHTEDHRVADRGFKDFGQVFRSWAYWRYGGPVRQLAEGAVHSGRAAPPSASLDHLKAQAAPPSASLDHLKAQAAPPSASLDHLKAQAAPRPSRAPRAQLGKRAAVSGARVRPPQRRGISPPCGRQVPQLRVLLGSEDKATFGAMPRLLLPSVAVWSAQPPTHDPARPIPRAFSRRRRAHSLPLLKSCAQSPRRTSSWT